jgi:hypothetical protein
LLSAQAQDAESHPLQKDIRIGDPSFRCGAGLIVGNNAYASPLRRLRYCARDAGRVKTKFLELSWPEDTLAVLQDANSFDLHAGIDMFVGRAAASFANAAGVPVVVFLFLLRWSRF